MTAAKQSRGNAGKGRKKGVPNKVTGDVKAMVLTALKRAGGAQYLEEQAHKNPVAFMSLVGRVLLANRPREDDANSTTLVIDATAVPELPGTDMGTGMVADAGEVKGQADEPGQGG
jgi:hypothetical protein